VRGFGWLDPHVDKQILEAAGETKVLEVHKHWPAIAWPAVRVLSGVMVIVSGLALQATDWGSWLFWPCMILGSICMFEAIWRWLAEYRDRFVITNQRIFRVYGVLATKRASVPLMRILDITVEKTVVGRWLGYGTFVFESAAQVQGLNRITFVGDIDRKEGVLRIVMQPDALQETENQWEGDGT